MTDIFLNNGDNYYYTRSQALTWVCSGPNGSNKLVNRHFEALKKMLVGKEISPIVIRCNSKIKFEENALITFLLNLNKSSSTITFVDLDSTVANEVKIIIESNETIAGNLNCELHCPSNQKSQLSITGKNKTKSPSSLTDTELDELELRRIKNVITNSYIVDKKILVSTTITATGEFDAFRIITEPSDFLWTTIKLAELVQNFIANSQSRDFRILSVSLRGSALGGAVAGFCGLGMNTIDHLGPKYRVIDLEFTETLKGKRYIYIGDFVIGGTEIKIAQAYTKMFGGELVQSFAIGSMLSEQSYSNSFNLKTLFKLSDISQVEYSIEDKN